MSIITELDLAAYLRAPLDRPMRLLTELANGIVTELPGAFGDTTPTRAKAITLEVAARAYRNPEGYAYERGDDYGYGLPADTRHAGVYLTDSERGELLALRGAAVGGSFFSLPLTSPLDLRR